MPDEVHHLFHRRRLTVSRAELSISFGSFLCGFAGTTLGAWAALDSGLLALRAGTLQVKHPMGQEIHLGRSPDGALKGGALLIGNVRAPSEPSIGLARSASSAVFLDLSAGERQASAHLSTSIGVRQRGYGMASFALEGHDGKPEMAAKVFHKNPRSARPLMVEVESGVGEEPQAAPARFSLDGILRLESAAQGPVGPSVGTRPDGVRR